MSCPTGAVNPQFRTVFLKFVFSKADMAIERQEQTDVPFQIKVRSKFDPCQCNQFLRRHSCRQQPFPALPPASNYSSIFKPDNKTCSNSGRHSNPATWRPPKLPSATLPRSAKTVPL